MVLAGDYRMKLYDIYKLVKLSVFKRYTSPWQLIHFITSRCNAKCSHCFYWENLNQNNNELTLEEIDKITKTLPDLYYLTISGGEPFLRQDLAAVIKTYYKNTPLRQVVIPTNGILKQKILKDCQDVMESCLGLKLNVGVSLDGLKDEHNRIRGVDCFDKAIDTFFALKGMFRNNKNFKTTVIATITASNQYNFDDFYNYVENVLKPDSFAINLIRGTPKDVTLSEINSRMYEKYLNLKMKRRNKTLRDYIDIRRSKIILQTFNENKQVIPCVAGKIDAVLYEDGRMTPCEMLNYSIGNIRDYDYDFRAVWKSEILDHYRQKIKCEKCFCTHECFMRTAIVFSPKEAVKAVIGW